MTISNFKEYIKNKSHRDMVCAFRKALVYILYRKGYTMNHIATALGLYVSNVHYLYNTAQDAVDTQEYLVLMYINDLHKNHIELQPHFEHDGFKYVVKTNIIFDGIKIDINYGRRKNN